VDINLVAMEPSPNSYHGFITHHIVFIIGEVILCFEMKE
jgi:hypothetical protein